MNIRARNTLSWTTALLMGVVITVALSKRAAADDNDPPGRVAK